MARPILERLCEYKDIYIFTIDDFTIMNEILDVKLYNDISANNYHKAQAENGNNN